MTMEGWIKIHRKLLEWEWYDDTNVVRVFLHLLLTANYESKYWHGIPIERGQIITSVNNLASETHLSVKQIRLALEKLKNTNEIGIETANKYSKITISKYDIYQCQMDEEGQTKDNQKANKGQTKGKQRATTKEYKEYKKERIEEDIITAETAKQKPSADSKNVYGEFKNVKLTDNEAEKLHNEFGDNAVGMVDYLSAYKVEKNYKTKSDYLTIKRWVADAFFKSLKSNSYGNGNDPTGIGYVSTERIVAAGRAMAEARR